MKVQKLDGTIPKTALNVEANLMRKRVAEIQEDIKNVLGFCQLILMENL